MTAAEVAELLHEAATVQPSGDFVRLSQIQVRLCQGIRGYACPRSIGGMTADAEMVLSALYCAWLRGFLKRGQIEEMILLMLDGDQWATAAARQVRGEGAWKGGPLSGEILAGLARRIA